MAITIKKPDWRVFNCNTCIHCPVESRDYRRGKAECINERRPVGHGEILFHATPKGVICEIPIPCWCPLEDSR